MSKRPMVPSFLQKIDDKLLRNKPGAWSARAHLIVYFAALFSLLLFVLCYFAFFDAKQYSQLGSWNTFLGMIALLGFVFWLIFLLRFNVFKRYGNWSPMDGLRDFGLYFISIGAMIAVCFVPSAVETLRANQQFSNEEVVNDINELNLNACKLEYNILPLKWKPDTCRVVDTLPAGYNVPAPPYQDVAVYQESLDSTIEMLYNPDDHLIDTAQLRDKLLNADSILKINDTAFVFYECPNYRFVSSYSADEYSSVKLLGSADIYNSVIKNYQKPNRNALLNRMQELKRKYAVSSLYYYGDYYDNNDSTHYTYRVSKKYDLVKIKNGIDNIVSKKYSWVKDWQDYFRVFYYITLLITMLVFIFRHSTRKTFFLSVLTSVLLIIFTGLVMVINRESEEISVLSFMLVYYAVFALLALSVFGTSIRRAVQGIGLNLFLFMTPFIPLTFVELYLSMHRRQYYNNQQEVYEPLNSSLYYLTAEIAGSIILIVLMQPLFKKLYRKWYAAPEE